MKAYADTNLFAAYLLPTAHSERCFELLEGIDPGGFPPLPVTRLLRLETINALQRLVFEAAADARLARVSREMALVAELEFDELTVEGDLWVPTEEPTEEVDAIFVNLVHRHTARHGFRTYDLLHVATALALECDTFWSFDARAKKLAKLEGLKTN